MKENNKDEGQELIDIDEIGRAEEKKGDIKEKSFPIYKIFLFASILIIIICLLYFFVCGQKNKKICF